MNKLETPYMVRTTSYNNLGIKYHDIVDRDGFDAFTCYAHDSDEILKRINDYDNLISVLGAAIELLASAEIQSSVRVKGMTKIIRDGDKALKKAAGK